MKVQKQKTLASPCTIEGKGLHLGLPVKMKFLPAEEGHGIRFRILEKDQSVEIPALAKNLNEKILRTALSMNGTCVETVEHVLAAASGLDITNLLIEMDNKEPAACDGAAFEICTALEKAGVIDQKADREEFVIKKSITVNSPKGGSITALPYSEGLKISYTLGGEGLPDQHVEYEHSPESFKTWVAPSRTFCREFEVEALKNLPDVGCGANEKNTLLVKLDTFEEQQKYANELAYHKILDLLGDLSLLGVHIRGHLICYHSGHSCNHELVRALRKEKNGCELNINEIKDILPHSYPFLLVDRILEYEENKRVVGLKNVTINEPYFPGHFPGEPIMPGVLLIEALAQTGAVFIYRYHGQGKLVLFTGVDKVKFRHRVVPGDQVILEVEAITMKAHGGVVKGLAKVGGAIACEAEMKFMVVNR